MRGATMGLVAAFLLLVAAPCLGAQEGLSFGMATGPLFFGGYYTHDDPDYRGYELEGYVVDASIAYRFGRIEAEAGGSWYSVTGAPADDPLASLSASRGFRPKIGLSLYVAGPVFLHLGAGYQVWTAKEGQPVAWNWSEAISAISRIGARFALGERLEAFAFYELSMEALPGPRGTRAYSARKDASGNETVLGTTVFGVTNAACLGIGFRP